MTKINNKQTPLSRLISGHLPLKKGEVFILMSAGDDEVEN